MVATLLQTVRAWTRAGICALGFRPPTSPAVRGQVDDPFIYDAAAFRARFEAHGGVWLEVATHDWATYDGHHLERVAAIAFSQELAGALARARKSACPRASH